MRRSGEVDPARAPASYMDAAPRGDTVPDGSSGRILPPLPARTPPPSPRDSRSCGCRHRWGRGQMVEATVGTGAERDAARSQAELPAIQLQGVVKQFPSPGGDVRAVEEVDLDIAEGEFFSLLGPSGCAKTTTLRMVAGFEEPTSGRILLHGRDVVGV